MGLLRCVRNDMDGLFLLAVSAVAKHLDRKFICLEMTLFSYLFQECLDFLMGELLDLTARETDQMTMGCFGDFRLIVTVILSKIHLTH